MVCDFCHDVDPSCTVFTVRNPADIPHWMLYSHHNLFNHFGSLHHTHCLSVCDIRLFWDQTRAVYILSCFTHFECFLSLII